MNTLPERGAEPVARLVEQMTLKEKFALLVGFWQNIGKADVISGDDTRMTTTFESAVPSHA